MLRSIELDHMLENAVAVALGLAKPHPQAPKKVRPARAKASRRGHHVTRQPRREPVKAAA